MFGRMRGIEEDSSDKGSFPQPIRAGSDFGCDVLVGDHNDPGRIVVIKQTYLGTPDRDFRYTVDDSMISIVYSEESGYIDGYVYGSVQPSRYWEKNHFWSKPTEISALSFSDMPFTIVTGITFRVPGGDLDGTVRGSFKFIKGNPRCISSILNSSYAKESTVYNVNRRYVTAEDLGKMIRIAFQDVVREPLFRETIYDDLKGVQDAIMQRIRETPFFLDRSIDVSEISVRPERTQVEMLQDAEVRRRIHKEMSGNDASVPVNGTMVTQAFVNMYSASMAEDGYRVCELELAGIGDGSEGDVVDVKVSINDEVIRSLDIPIVSNDSRRQIITIPESIAEGMLGRTVRCTLTADDKHHRKLAFVSRDVMIGEVCIDPRIDVKTSLKSTVSLDPDAFTADIASGVLTSNKDIQVYLTLRSGGRTLWQSGINLSPKILSDFTISLDRTTLASLNHKEVSLEVNFDGHVLYTESSRIVIDGVDNIPTTVTSAPNIYMELDIADMVDTHDTLNGIIRIGSLFLDNGGESMDVVMSIVLDGKNIRHSRVNIPRGVKEIGLSVPSTSIVNDSTCVRELTIHIADMSGNMMFHRVHTLVVRSKFDMDLSEIDTRAVQFINPHCEQITRLIHDSDGLLAQAMGDPYVVCGYQDGGKHVIRQMRAAYMMLHDMKMNYVSNSFAFNGLEDNYQHVKTPSKVMDDRSGNCIELCILYASLMEAMGLEPVLAFLQKHILVGVVLSTDLYSSKSAYHEDEDIPYVTMDVRGGKADVMFLDMTACTQNNDFIDVVCLAYNKAIDELDTICDEEGHVFVKMMRMIGVDPLVDTQNS